MNHYQKEAAKILKRYRTRKEAEKFIDEKIKKVEADQLIYVFQTGQPSSEWMWPVPESPQFYKMVKSAMNELTEIKYLNGTRDFK